MLRILACLSLALLSLTSPALAVFEVEMPLATLVAKSETIAVVQVEKFSREQERATLVVERLLKGSNLERLPLLLRGDGDGNPLDMLARIENGTQLVLFLAPISPTEEMIFAYTEGSWFKLRGVPAGGIVRSQFVQGEPYLLKSYAGKVDPLLELIVNKGELPPIDSAIKPGLGPTLFALAEPQPSDETTAEILLSPTWLGEQAAPKATASPWRDYTVAALLTLATATLAFLLTRSQRSDLPV